MIGKLWVTQVRLACLYHFSISLRGRNMLLLSLNNVWPVIISVIEWQKITHTARNRVLLFREASLMVSRKGPANASSNRKSGDRRYQNFFSQNIYSWISVGFLCPSTAEQCPCLARCCTQSSTSGSRKVSDAQLHLPYAPDSNFRRIHHSFLGCLTCANTVSIPNAFPWWGISFLSEAKLIHTSTNL